MPPTRWSTVLNAGGHDSPEARAALERLCGTYWYPLYSHVRRRGHGAEDAADHTQAFLLSLLQHNSLARVSPEKGRFRTFLLTSLDYYLRDHSDRQRAVKRGAGQRLIELDALAAEQRLALEPATDETPDKSFDRRWATALLEQSLARLEAEQAADGRRELFQQLRPLLLREVERGEYEHLGSRLDLAPNTVAKTVQRLRQRARELMLDEAAQTVVAAGDAERELRELFG